MQDEQIYRAVFDRTSNGSIILQRKNSQQFIILAANPASLEVGAWHNLSLEDIIGRNILDLFEGSREMGLLEKYNETLDSGATAHLGEFEYSDPEVPYGIFDIDLKPLSDEYLLVSYTNITQRKLAEERFREGEQRLQTIVDTAVEAIITINENGTIESVNQATEEIFGYTADQLVGQNVKMLMPQPFHSEHDGYITNYLKTGDAQIIGIGRQVLGQRQDGSTFPLELAVSATTFKGHKLFTGIIRDITLRVQSEEEQRQRQWVLEQVYEFRQQTSSLPHDLDLLDQIAPLVEKIMGHFNPVRVEIYHDGHSYTSGLKAPLPAPYLSESFLIEGREQGHISLSCATPVAIAIQRECLTKLTETIAYHIVRRQYETHLLQSSHLRALGELSGGISHELNQPLTSIRAFAEVIVYSMKGNWDMAPVEISGNMEKIIAQVDRMATTIEHMRALTHSTAEENPVLFCIDDVIVNLFNLIGEQLTARNIKTEIHMPTHLPSCWGWPYQLEQALLHLVTNARQAIEDNIAMQQGNSAVLQIDVSEHASENTLQIDVKDTGGGIPEGLVKHIFKPFFTSRRVGEGAGLGLSIARSIVQQHQGSLEVENRPGSGATFTIILPKAQ